MRRGLVFILAVVLLVFGSKAAHAVELAEFDAKIINELEAAMPAAVPLFREANEARERGDHARAEQLYGETHALAPGFLHAQRRQCGERTMLGRHDDAIALCRQLIAADPSGLNLSTLALALSQSTRENDRKEALEFAEQAAEEAPAESTPQLVLCQIAVERGDANRLRTCIWRLGNLLPESPAEGYYAAILYLSEGRFDDAEAAIERARIRGLDEEVHRGLSAAIASARPSWPRWLGIGGFIALGWGAVFALLLLVGLSLSRATLAAATASAEGSGHASDIHRHLRRFYASVLWMSCGFYYLSLPLVSLAVLLFGGGIIYGFVALGYIPFKLVLIVLALALGSIWAIAKSLFVRHEDVEPGMPLELTFHPKLRAALDEVAEKIGTRPVDTVYLTPTTDIAVFERGGLRKQLGGERERCLVLGAGVLEGLKLQAFKAILAHEYGHFSNRDTAGGGFALAVRRSLLTMANHLAERGAATRWNPAWLFVAGFYKLFLRVSHGASRLQEILADRFAAYAYGPAAFEQGLRHVVECSVRFDAHLDATVTEVIEQKRPLSNLYRYEPEQPPASAEIEKQVEEALNAKGSPYDSHPTPAERFAWVHALPITEAVGSKKDAEELDAWALFSDRLELEAQMTRELRIRLARAGYEIEESESIAA